MIRFLTCACLLVSAYGQTSSFEVASIKPAPPPSTPGMMRVGMRRDPGRVTYSGMSLKMLIQTAFRVKGYQISGPAWLESERFEIVAKLPEGASLDLAPEMLQKLLADRFGLKLHRDTKELPVYALVTGKNGPKLEEVENAPAGAAPGNPGAGSMMRMEPGKLKADRVKLSGLVNMISRMVRPARH